MANSLVTSNNGHIKAIRIRGNRAPLRHACATFAFPTDANYTATVEQYQCLTLSITAGVISAGRSIILPLIAEAEYWVTNNTAQTVTFIGATGTGVAVATTKSARIRCDGTNYIRMSADA